MKIIFRTDASTEIGTGHVMRCIALAQTMKDAGDDVTFVSAGLEERLKKEEMEAMGIAAKPYDDEDARETARHAKQTGAEWVVVDGYDFGADYQAALKREGVKVLFLDDYGHAGSYCADIVLNQNVSAREEWYKKKGPETRLLLGPRYAMLRREFRAWKDRRKERTGPVQNILVTLGGTDPHHVTAQVIDAVGKTAFPGTVTVVIGSGNPHLRELRHQAAASKVSIGLVANASDMPVRMAESDFAIAAAGTTSWELLCMGVPFLTGAFAENQVAVAAALEKQGLAKNAGWYPDISEDDLVRLISQLIHDEHWRAEHSRKGIETIDGEGVVRVLQAMNATSAQTPTSELTPPLTVRDATIDDARLLHEWANDPVIRESSFSPDQISWETHKKWIEGKLADKNSKIFIGMDGDRPVGQIRFDIRNDGDAEIDIHLAPEARGKGYGTPLIEEGLKRFFKATTSGAVHAFAKTDNDASRKAFLKAGFKELGKETLRGNPVYHLVFHRP
ncbi:MAG: UDP-2,4-diacetamido-2,4,6-trideoxy-beta-L-altropyranose hydrolase [Candidatus Peribacteraceae bacterium]|nr:UDP-2,4-diacetamido-2,4,6-trideoxy-beta-L-altropyranose hydrolase [Candidatus Peribacteraceae bacterium]